jgi:hypothetical protein
MLTSTVSLQRRELYTPLQLYDSLEVIEKSAGGAKGCLDAENLTGHSAKFPLCLRCFLKQMD